VTDDHNPLAGLSEAQFQRQVMKIAAEWGWRVVHIGRARVGKRWITPTRGPDGEVVKGFPDLVLVRPPDVVFLELKKRGGVVSAEQRAWISDLQKCADVEAYIVGPDDAADVWRLLAQRP